MTAWLPDGTVEWGGRPVAYTAAAATSRSRVHLHARVTSLASRRTGTPNGPLADTAEGAAVDVTVDDGTATIILRWLGRSEIPGLALGVMVEVEGTVLMIWGERVVLNPLYRFVAEPAAERS